MGMTRKAAYPEADLLGTVPLPPVQGMGPQAYPRQNLKQSPNLRREQTDKVRSLYVMLFQE